MISSLDWDETARELDDRGWAILPNLLDAQQCEQTAALYDRDELFRSRVVMGRHGFGCGEYQYFAYPMPPLVATLRATLYPHLASIANAWQSRLRRDGRFPSELESFLRRCHSSGQARPTPLLLKYGPGDYNCLHQDLYGELVFPLQVAILLDRPGVDFEGGEFVLTEQRPRMQSRPMVVPLSQGSGVVFALNDRPVRGGRGDYQVKLCHGVSVVRSGRRRTLGLIFHDAA